MDHRVLVDRDLRASHFEMEAYEVAPTIYLSKEPRMLLSRRGSPPD
jgi:hypothetical protein